MCLQTLDGPEYWPVVEDILLELVCGTWQRQSLMAAKDVLAGKPRGQGTKVAEYSEAGPFHCEDCVFLKAGGPDKDHGL